MNTTKSNSK